MLSSIQRKNSRLERKNFYNLQKFFVLKAKPPCLLACRYKNPFTLYIGKNGPSERKKLAIFAKSLQLHIALSNFCPLCVQFLPSVCPVSAYRCKTSLTFPYEKTRVVYEKNFLISAKEIPLYLFKGKNRGGGRKIIH